MLTERQVPDAIRENHRLGCRLTQKAGRGLASQLAAWAQAGKNGYVCVANTHQVVLAQTDIGLRNALDDALAVTTDSQVLAYAMGKLGAPYPEPILYGPDLMQAVIAAAALNGLSVGLFGSNPKTCQAVSQRMRQDHPDLKITGITCPPIKSLAQLVDQSELDKIVQPIPDILLVSLGCPKQEQWMHQTNKRIPGVKIGLGGAFDFYAGTTKRSPAWVHRAGLEWLYRLSAEPERLLKRYLVNNPQFVLLWLQALVRR